MNNFLKCKVCSSNFSPINAKYQLVKCDNCSLVFSENIFSESEIIKTYDKLYNKTAPDGIMPMSIHKLGNSSVATVPTLYDMLIKNKIENQNLNKGDVIIFASVGAGMNVNAIVYRM